MKVSKDEAEDFRLVIGLLLLILDWTRKKLGAKAGIDEGALSRYGNGSQKAQPGTWEKIEGATRIPLEAVRALLPILRRLRSLAEGRSMPAHEEAAAIARTVGSTVEAVLRLEEPYLCGRDPEATEPPISLPQATDRLVAEDLWERLKARTHSARVALVEEVPKYQSWALAERLCAESIQVAAGDPKQALELAELALRVAELVTGEPAWCFLLAGFVWAHLGNARRVASDLPGAEKAFSQAWKLWEAGAAADTGLLDGSRLLDLEASLLRARRHFAVALKRLDQALALHPMGTWKGGILLNKGSVLEQMGSYEEAVETSRKRRPGSTESASRAGISVFSLIGPRACVTSISTRRRKRPSPKLEPSRLSPNRPWMPSESLAGYGARGGRFGADRGGHRGASRVRAALPKENLLRRGSREHGAGWALSGAGDGRRGSSNWSAKSSLSSGTRASTRRRRRPSVFRRAVELETMSVELGAATRRLISIALSTTRSCVSNHEPEGEGCRRLVVWKGERLASEEATWLKTARASAPFFPGQRSICPVTNVNLPVANRQSARWQRQTARWQRQSAGWHVDLHAGNVNLHARHQSICPVAMSICTLATSICTLATQSARWQRRTARWQRQSARWQRQSARWQRRTARWQRQSARWQRQSATGASSICHGANRRCHRADYVATGTDGSVPCPRQIPRAALPQPVQSWQSLQDRRCIDAEVDQAGDLVGAQGAEVVDGAGALAGSPRSERLEK